MAPPEFLMRRPPRAASVALVALLLVAAPRAPFAASTDKAVEAMQKGDFKTAKRELAPLVEKNDPNAQFLMGMMYDAGKGVAQDQSKAIDLLSKSAAQRNTRAMGMLATSLFSRHRDEQDLIDAYAWSHLAAESDPIQAATSARKVIAQYCSEGQKKKAKKVMSDWKRKWAAEDKAR